jgi:hypothetical protein
VLDTVDFIPTRHRNFKRTNENFKSKIPIEVPEYLQTMQKKVTVEVTITGKTSSFFGLKQTKD